MKRLIITLAALYAAAGCVRFDIDEILLPREDISLTMKGEDQFTYNPLTCQMSHNSTTNEFRVFNDRLSDWFILKCQDRPGNVGQEVTADLSWTTDKSTRSMSGLTFRVEKTDADGTIWMWCKQKSIGIVIKNL